MASEWQDLALDTELRLRAVRDYATYVLGRDAAEQWLARQHPAIRSGHCSALAACREIAGFVEVMAALAQHSEARRRADEDRLHADLDSSD